MAQHQDSAEIEADVVAEPTMAGGGLGPYRILDKLGEGGMGEVYRARDTRLERQVALKVLPAELAEDPDRRARLLHEAKAAAALNHPNICTIYEVGEADGRAYIAMEVVDGLTLNATLSGGSLPVDMAIRYGLELAAALAHAHERGVVHRDLKSANVAITAEGRVKVLDFGLARRVAALDGADATQTHHSLTTPGTILGTLPYMAPEQLRGEAADVRTDIWALGIVLYEMTAGVRPFGGRTNFELSSAIFHNPLPPLPPRVPSNVQAIIARCLEKEPGRRYQRAGEVHAALAATGADAAVPQRTASSRRQSPAATLVTAIAAVALVATAAAWWQRPMLEQWLSGDDAIRSLAVLPLQNLAGDPGEEYFVAGIHEALITDLARIGLQKVIAKPSADAFKGTSKSLQEIGRELGVNGLVTGSVRRANDRVQVTAQLVRADSGVILWANRYEQSARDVLALQNEIVTAIAREIQPSLALDRRRAAAPPVNAAAHDEYLKARSMYATFVNSSMNRTLLENAAAGFERAILLDPDYAPPYAALSNVYLNASQSSLLPPAEVFPKARAAALKAIALDDSLADGHAALGDVELWYGWNWTAAEREIRRALELSPDSTAALRTSQNYATLVSDEFEEARRTSQRILDLDPLNPFSRLQTVWISFFTRRHDESISRAKAMRELWPANVMAAYFLAANYAVKRMASETNAECDAITAQVGAGYGMRLMGQCVWALGVVGRTVEARRLLARLGDPPTGTWLDPAVMAQAHAGLGDADRAIAWLKKGIAERSPTMLYLKVSPLFDAVRRDPRFLPLLRDMNFP